MTTLTVDIENRRRVFEPADFPLGVGGPRTHIPIPGGSAEKALAFFGIDGGDVYVQPAEPSGEAGSATCNGIPLTASRWVENGDRLTIGPARITITATPGNVHLRIEGASEDDRRSLNPAAAGDFVAAPDGQPVSPAPFTPRWHASAPRRRATIRPRTLAVAAAFAVLATAAWYVLTARPVRVEVVPPADHLEIAGVAPGFKGSFLLRHGSYRFRAEKTGYMPLDTTLEIDAETPPVLRFALEPLGATVTFRSRPVTGAAISVDGNPVGETPLEDLPLNAGSHSIVVQAPLHLPYSTTLEIAAGNPPIVVDADLHPNWAPVTVASSPPNAQVLVDRVSVGRTPTTIDVEAGSRVITLRLAGFKAAGRNLEITPGAAVDLGRIVLQPQDGTLVITSQPEGATVTVETRYRGTTPLELTVPPNSPLDIGVSRAGHASYREQISIAPGQRREVRAVLEMLTGEILVTSQPAGAEIVIDGTPRGRTEQRIELEARPHTVELRLEGYVSHQTTITPEPGLTQAVRATLKPAGAAGLAQTITTPQGAELVLVGPGRFTMGASRREPGRRANEVLRDVELTTSFYIAVREVSNQEYREFKSDHLSGAYAGHNLEIDHHPVVNVTWEDAARYCNWLSTRAGLTPVYVERAGSMVPLSPLPNGYRLPTEAEWSWAARFGASPTAVKYIWGDALPIPNGAGNFGDSSAETALRSALPEYRDGFAATAPAGSFSANRLGLYNLGGNVSEWVQDVYAFAPGARGVVERDPLGPASGPEHVIRGASWMDTTVTELRLTYRDHGNRPRPDLGFRLARSAQ